MPDKAFFEQNSWFASLPPHLAECLLSTSKPRQLSKGQRLHGKDDEAEGLFCVVSGRIRVSNVNQHGKEMVLTWLESGSWFGEISLFDGMPRTHDAHAETSVSLLVIPVNTFHQLLQSTPELYPHFARLLCDRLRATFSIIDESGGLSLTGQVAKRLILLGNGFTRQQSKKPMQPIAISQEELAHMLNTSRQTINGIFQALQKQQVIKLGYRRIEVLNETGLYKLAEL